MNPNIPMAVLELAQEAENEHGWTSGDHLKAVIHRAGAYLRFICENAYVDQVDDGGDAHEPYMGNDDEELEKEYRAIEGALWRRKRQDELREKHRVRNDGDSDGLG